MDQLGQSKLAIPECLSDAVFNDPAFKVNRLPGRKRQLEADNTAAVVKKDYLDIVTREEATKFWAIMP